MTIYLVVCTTHAGASMALRAMGKHESARRIVQQLHKEPDENTVSFAEQMKCTYHVQPITIEEM